MPKSSAKTRVSRASKSVSSTTATATARVSPYFPPSPVAVAVAASVPSPSHNISSIKVVSGLADLADEKIATTRPTRRTLAVPMAKQVAQLPRESFDVGNHVVTVTPFRARVYNLLCQIPRGRVSTYAALSKALSSSPRAVGGACASNPFAPEVPCHRIISSSGHVGGFFGEWEKTTRRVSGVNQVKKLKLLRDEGVEFDDSGRILERERVWDGFVV
jgi:methylated-DNA-[protein]-cysteine S-methyltransferase